MNTARELSKDLDWLRAVLAARLGAWFQEGSPPFRVREIPPPLLSGGHWSALLSQRRATVEERLVLLLALAPHLRPHMLDVLFVRNESTGRGFSEFGGFTGAAHGGFIPTGETACWLLSGDDLELRLAAMRLFEGEHWFSRERVLSLGPATPPEPPMSGGLNLSRDWVQRLLTGADAKPGFSTDFPAHLLRTERHWQELVLPHGVLEQLEEIRTWIQHAPTLMRDWGMGRKLRPGFTSLFFGPPGTGKTLSATLLGKHCEVDVYRIDLSAVISKYIGETEKNLSRIFDLAEHRRWILFFDEADALFGRRTRVDDSHDRYANQEVSYLLQRVEDHPGVVILASNMKSNIDDAFLRRFQSVVHFPMPRPAERERLWRQGFSERCRLDPRLDLTRIAGRFDLSGGTILNVIRYASLRALARGEELILAEDVDEGIRRELAKEGRSV